VRGERLPRSARRGVRIADYAGCRPVSLHTFQRDALLRNRWRGPGDLVKVFRCTQDGETFIGHAEFDSRERVVLLSVVRRNHGEPQDDPTRSAHS